MYVVCGQVLASKLVSQQVTDAGESSVSCRSHCEQVLWATWTIVGSSVADTFDHQESIVLLNGKKCFLLETFALRKQVATIPG